MKTASSLWLSTLALFLGPILVPAYGAETTSDDPASSPSRHDLGRSAWAEQLPVTQTLTFQLLPERFQHRERGRTVRVIPDSSRQQSTRRPKRSRIGDLAGGPVAYRDRAALVTRLREFDGLRLVTFWESKDLRVFFGVSRDGFAGLNLRQPRKTKSKSSADKD